MPELEGHTLTGRIDALERELLDEKRRSRTLECDVADRDAQIGALVGVASGMLKVVRFLEDSCNRR
jgi:hypothetical protein